MKRTVETTIYCAPEAVGKGLGSRLYAALCEALRGEDIPRYVGGSRCRTASADCHARWDQSGRSVFGVRRKLGVLRMCDDGAGGVKSQLASRTSFVA